MKNRMHRLITNFALLISCHFTTGSLLATQPGAPVLSKTEASHLEEKETILNPALGHFSAAFRQIFTEKNNLIHVGTGIAATLIARPFDDDISRDLKEDNFNEFEVRLPNKVGSFFVVAGVPLLTHIIGRVAKKPVMANTGLYMFEAVMITQLVTGVIKKAVGRTRPDASNDLSFPSGHTSAMTAIAGVLQKRHGWKAGIAAYLLATYVGVTRIKTQKHFASDVLAGATIGTLIGINFVPSEDSTNAFGIAPLIGKEYAGIQAEVRF